MNRAEVEHLQSVATICQATDSSQLGKVITNVRDIISKSKNIIDSDALEVPGELKEIISNAANQFTTFLGNYEAKGAEIAKSNQTVLEMINRSMARAQSSGADATQRMGSAAKTTDDIKGGVKL